MMASLVQRPLLFGIGGFGEFAGSVVTEVPEERESVVKVAGVGLVFVLVLKVVGIDFASFVGLV
jgi:hypothetical protein